MQTTDTDIDALDADIAALQARLTTLHAHRANLASILLSQPHLATHLQAPTHPLIAQQTTRNTSNIYRACAGITAYKVLDPDPHAPNGGAILGLSIDVSLLGKFIDTYHVLLRVHATTGGLKDQQQKQQQQQLRVHKHTIPPCIPLQQLVNKWLPVRNDDDNDNDAADPNTEQQLVRFGRGLRRELVCWHLRMDTLAALKREAGVDTARKRSDAEAEALEKGHVLNAFVSEDEAASSAAEEDDDDEEGDERGLPRITDVQADAAVRQVMLAWSDRRTAIVNVAKDGRVEKAVCRARDGSRDVARSRKAMGPMAGLVRRMAA